MGYMFTFNLHVAQYYNHAEVSEIPKTPGEESDMPQRRQEERFCASPRLEEPLRKR